VKPRPPGSANNWGLFWSALRCLTGSALGSATMKRSGPSRSAIGLPPIAVSVMRSLPCSGTVCRCSPALRGPAIASSVHDPFFFFNEQLRLCALSPSGPTRTRLALWSHVFWSTTGPLRRASEDQRARGPASRPAPFRVIMPSGFPLVSWTGDSGQSCFFGQSCTARTRRARQDSFFGRSRCGCRRWSTATRAWLSFP